MSANGALVKEIMQIAEINQRIQNGENVYGHRKPIRLHLIKPEHPLPLDSALYTGQISHARLIEMGKSDARKYFASMTPEGILLEPGVLQMTQQSPGIFSKKPCLAVFLCMQPTLKPEKSKATAPELNCRCMLK
jgi:hypothetical protein